MDYVLIIHAVKDYEIWKKVFDSAADIRELAGEQSYQLLVDERIATRIVHFSKWESLAKAREFFESPKLVQIRKEAGVESPEFIYLTQTEAGNL